MHKGAQTRTLAPGTLPREAGIVVAGLAASALALAIRLSF